MSSVQIDITEEQDLDQLLKGLDQALRRKLIKKAVRRAGMLVRNRARQLVPQSRQSGSRQAWSASTRAQRAGVQPLRDTIQVAVRDYDDNFVAFIGPTAPLGHLVEFARRKVLWGQDTGETVSNEGRRFMRPAADETKSQQVSVMTQTILDGIHRAGG